MAGRGCDVVMYESCYCRRFQTVKKSLRVTYSDRLPVTGVKREIIEYWGDSEDKELLLV